MYVYLCADTPSSTHTSTSVKLYRKSSSSSSSSSSESIECSYLTPAVNDEILVELNFIFFQFNSLFCLNEIFIFLIFIFFLASKSSC